MINTTRYFDFIRLKGKSLTEINPGSKELALNVNDALEAIELLKDVQQPILGGDVLTDNLGSLGYAYQFWGAEYHCLDWYCEKMDKESQIDYYNRTYELAKDSINRANEVAKKIGKNCYIVFVV